MIADLASIGERDVRVLQGPRELLDVIVVERVDVRRDDQERVAGGGLAPAVECASERELLLGDGDDLAAGCLGHLDGTVRGAGVDENQLVGRLRLSRQAMQQPPQVRLLIERADHG